MHAAAQLATERGFALEKLTNQVKPETFVYRCKYTKGYEARFVSHLDMVRIYSRAARRAGIPVFYSMGFNPHPSFVFGQPLSVGVTSECEYVDIELEMVVPVDFLQTEMNKVLPQGIHIDECRKLEPGTPNIMKAVNGGIYELEIAGEFDSAAMKATYDSEKSLVVMKKSKSGVTEMDVRPLIFKFEIECKEPGLFTVYLETQAGNILNLKPEAAFEAILQYTYEEIPVFEYISINKKGIIYENRR